MTDLSRRHALTATVAGALAAALPSAAAAELQREQPGVNDQRLVHLRDRYFALVRLKERERKRLGDTKEADDRSDRILALQDAVIERMTKIPADSMTGLSAKAGVCEREHRILNCDRHGTLIEADPLTQITSAMLADARRLGGEA